MGWVQETFSRFADDSGDAEGKTADKKNRPYAPPKSLSGSLWQ
ncbi:hypothetical protein [Desulfonema ishimotonii]|nr:hypothetical protein [Desulfonema ishimotonii]